MTYLDETLAAALDLARAGRWQRALSLLDAAAAATNATNATNADATAAGANADERATKANADATAVDATKSDAPTANANANYDATTDGADGADASSAGSGDRAAIALTAAEVALQSDLFAATALAGDRLATAERLGGSSWDLDFLRLRHDYLGQLAGAGAFQFGPDGKDAAVLAQLRKRATDLSDSAPDARSHGWARMYLGLILDNLFADRDAAPDHYEAALRAGEEGDDLLTREALRHLGDHDRDNGDLVTAAERWKRATFLGARAGLVAGTLSQQMLLALLSRDLGDEPAATRLAEEIARWTDAIGAERLHAQATAFLSGTQIA